MTSSVTKQQETCQWTFISSPMGAQAGWHYSTQCGHNVSIKPLERCDYCGKLVTTESSV